MPIIDPGMTVVDDFGRPLLSPRAIHLERPPDISSVVNPKPTFNSPNNIPMQAPGPVQNVQNAANVAPSMQPNTPKYSIPSDRYKDVESQAPQRNDPSLQHHGLAKFGDVLASLAGGPFASIVYNRLKELPFRQATRDWQERLTAIEPEVHHQEAEMRERGIETSRQETQAGLDKYRDEETAHRTALENEAEEKTAETQRQHDLVDAAKLRKDNLTKSLTLAKINQNPKKADDVYRANLQKQNLGQELTPEESAFQQSYVQWNDERNVRPGVERAREFTQTRPVPVADDSGAVHYDTAGHAISSGAKTPQSTDFQVLRGKALASVPTATVRTMAQRSKTILPQMEAISNEVDALKDKIGPAVGRWNELWVNKAGFNDPAFSNLDTKLELLSSAIVLAHGLRGEKYVERLRKHFREAQSPDDLKARIAGADAFITGYAGMIGDPAAGPKVENPNKPKHDLGGLK